MCASARRNDVISIAPISVRLSRILHNNGTATAVLAVPVPPPLRQTHRTTTVTLAAHGLFVSLFVSDYSRTTGYEAAYERYQRLQCYKGKKINVAISLKRLRSRDMA